MSDNATELEEPNEMLATRRPKRSTAGNRMEAALAEMALEENKEVVDEDKDFENLKDEEDVFGSDFESTDEEAENVVAEAGENAIVDEERRARKVAKSRLEKVTAAAHARNKETFNADVSESSSAKPKPKPKLIQRRVMGLTIGDSGEVLESISLSAAGNKRTSQRKHTVMNTSATVIRLKESQKRKAAQPKKAKIEVKRYTQAQLIARALDNEEGNIVQHRDYLKNEEEKRKRARVVRAAVQGPLLRWISKEGEDKVVVPPPLSPAPNPAPVIYKNTHSFIPSPYSYAASGGSFNLSTTSTSQSAGPPNSTFTSNLATSPQFQTYRYYNDPVLSAFPMWPPPPPQPVQHQPYYPPVPTPTVPTPPTPSDPPNQQTATASPGLTLAFNQPPPTSPVVPQPPPEPEIRIEKACKNYLVHELAQVKGTSRPNWVQSMQAMFGDHVKWDEIKVFSGKNRPLSRPRHICPISGMQAHYFDPRTGVPYADSQAYKVLTELFNHHYEWSASLGCYVGKNEDEAMLIDDT